jgi:hypothetical protein
MSSSDIQTKRVTTAASLGVGPARIRQIQVLTSAAGAGRLTITDGAGGRTTFWTSTSLPTIRTQSTFQTTVSVVRMTCLLLR